MSTELTSVLERQLLLQLGDRLKRLREAQGIDTVEMAKRVGVTRNTLRAVESGDPGTSIGTYVRVMSILGVGGELALLGSDVLAPAPAGSKAARSRRFASVVEVKVSTDRGGHQLQDLQSLVLHEEAVRLAKMNPKLVEMAKATAQRWLDAGDSRSAALWREWLAILDAGAWRKVLGRTRRAQQLRQASPLVTVLPEDLRRRILADIGDLKRGVVMGGDLAPPLESPERPKQPTS